MDMKIQIPIIPEEELTPSVKALLDVINQCMEIIQSQKMQIQQFKDEIARLKGGNPKPKIQPSKLDSDINGKKQHKRGERRKKRKKRMKINQEKKLQAKDVPEGSTFKGYKPFIVQDLVLQAMITKYYREDWETPDGRRILASLPEGIRGHYGAPLREYILNLNYGLNVPQHLILENLDELGIHISEGQIQSILTEGHEEFHKEKERLLEEGLKNFSYVSVDDTGARHQGKNGYCTHIGNDFFAYFKSTSSKSRINFLKILRGPHTDYVFTQESFDYMALQELSSARNARLAGVSGKILKDEQEWESFLKMVGIKNDKEIKIVTEAAVLGSILSHGINKDIVILSDEAGQFDILLHALCWLHAERKIAMIVPLNDYQLNILENIRTDIWGFYNALKIYKLKPGEDMKQALEIQFEELFTHKTEFEAINKALHLIHENKKGLLMALERPEVPLHNNTSENAIRVMVTKRKIHGGTRSEPGRQCRDTFISLKKTCLKLGISFHEFLYDRLSGNNQIPPLYEIMLEKAFSGT
jgi:hypothetical protein